MKLHLTSSEYQFLTDHLINPLKQQKALVWGFGSRARGDHRRFSDVDIMVESQKDLTPQIEEIKEFFSKSNFPYKIDLVQWSDFADSYKESFLKDKVDL